MKIKHNEMPSSVQENMKKCPNGCPSGGEYATQCTKVFPNMEGNMIKCPNGCPCCGENEI